MQIYAQEANEKMHKMHQKCKKFKKCEIKIVPLDSIFQESNFCRGEQHISGKEKKMQMHQVPGP